MNPCSYMPVWLQTWLWFSLLALLTTPFQGMEEGDWRPDPPMGRSLLAECETATDCAPICGYCFSGSKTCGSTAMNYASCTVGDQTGVCINSYCLLCVADMECGSAPECAKCGVRANGAQYCDRAMTDGLTCDLVGGGQGSCLSGECVNSVANDPIIAGFNGQKFHFDEVGDFTLLEEGQGWKVDVTFSAPPSKAAFGDIRESSWTTGVRVYNPRGDLVSCAMPAVFPNTSLVSVEVAPAGADPVPLSVTNKEATLDQMTTTTLLSWKEYAGVQYSTVVGCRVLTPLMDIRVYQVSGWEEAQAKPEEHGWAAPFTWLNLDFYMHQKLTAPVTGIMGATYPQAGVEGTPAVDQAPISPGAHQGAEGGAAVWGGSGSASRHFLHSSAPFPLAFSVVGL